MNSDEIGMIERLVNGYWPNPVPSDDELAVWEKSLAPFDFEITCEVLELMSDTGTHFRPTAGEFVHEYRARSARPKAFPLANDVAQIDTGHAGCGHSFNAVACPESVAYWMNKIRGQLAEARGPLAGAMSEAVCEEAR